MLRKIDSTNRERLYSRVLNSPTILRFVLLGKNFAVNIAHVSGVAYVSPNKKLNNGSGGSGVSFLFKQQDVSILDIRSAGIVTPELSQYSTIIVLKLGDQMKGIIVEKIIGVSSVAIDDFSPLTANSQKPYSFVDGVITSEEGSVLIVDVATLVRGYE